MKKISILTLIFIFIFNLTACNTTTNDAVSLSNFYFDTAITITIYDCDKDVEPEYIIKECFALCDHYDKLLGRTYDDSDISKINKGDGNFVKVDSIVSEIINAGIKYGDLTDGSFDITIAPITSLWNIGTDKATVPTDTSLKKALKSVDYNKIKIKNDMIKLIDSNAKIDLGGIAKGFIADKLKTYMLSKGVTSAIIDLGGNILTIGKTPDNDTFNIGIKKPFTENVTEYVATIKIKDKSVVTSGVYERYFEENGKMYHHILNPKTGYPVENELNSVTIISDNSVDGDALSTGAFVLGLDNGLDLINSLDGIEAVFIKKDNEIVISDGLEINSDNQIYITN